MGRPPGLQIDLLVRDLLHQGARAHTPAAQLTACAKTNARPLLPAILDAAARRVRVYVPVARSRCASEVCGEHSFPQADAREGRGGGGGQPAPAAGGRASVVGALDLALNRAGAYDVLASATEPRSLRTYRD
jgi:hypothetical protein